MAKDTTLQNVYIIQTEEPDGYYFRPEGVVFIDSKGTISLYSLDTRYNFLKAALHKHSYEDLQSGVFFRDHTIQLRNVYDELSSHFAMSTASIPDILQRIYLWSPRQYFFLERYAVREYEK